MPHFAVCKRVSPAGHALLFLFAVLLWLHPTAAWSGRNADPSTPNPLPPSVHEDFFTIRAEIHIPLAYKIHATLEVLHQAYPGQFHLWQAMVERLPIGDPDWYLLTELTEQATLVLKSIASHSESINSQMQELSLRLDTYPGMGHEEKDAVAARLYFLARLQERLAVYEVSSQAFLEQIHRLLVQRQDILKREEFRRVLSFSELRNTQVRSCLLLLSDVEEAENLLNQAELPLNLALGTGMELESQVMDEFTSELENRKTRRGLFSFFTKETAQNRIAGLLADVARSKSRELRSSSMTVMQAHGPNLWSLLHVQPEYAHGMSADRAADSPSHLHAAIKLAAALDVMRPGMLELHTILTDRNEALQPLLNNDFFDSSFLNTQLTLQAFTLDRMRNVLQNLQDKTFKPADVPHNRELAALFEEFGFLKEELLAVEALILSECNIMARSTPIRTKSEWQRISEALARQSAWQEGWEPLEEGWREAVQTFNAYRKQTLSRTIFSLELIEQALDTKKSGAETSQDLFLSLLGSFLDRQIERLKFSLKTIRQLERLKEDDPLLAGLFHSSPNDFWHHHAGEGMIFSTLDRICAQVTDIEKDLRRLLAPNIGEDAYAYHALAIASALEMVQELARNDSGYVAVVGSGDEILIFEKLVESSEPTIRPLAAHGPSGRSQVHLFAQLNALLTVPEAHAGVWDFWNNLKKNWTVRSYRDNVVNQVSKNKWSYVITGVAGVALAVPTAGASLLVAGKIMAVQLGADSMIAGTRSVVHAGNPAQKEKYDRYINYVETGYQFGKVVESGVQIYKSRKAMAEAAQKAEEVSRGVKEAGKQAVDKISDISKSRGFWSEMAQDAFDTLADNLDMTDEAKQAMQAVVDFADSHVVNLETKMVEHAAGVVRESKTGAKMIAEILRPFAAVSRMTENVMNTAGSADNVRTTLKAGQDLSKMLTEGLKPATATMRFGDSAKTTLQASGADKKPASGAEQQPSILGRQQAAQKAGQKGSEAANARQKTEADAKGKQQTEEEKARQKAIEDAVAKALAKKKGEEDAEARPDTPLTEEPSKPPKPPEEPVPGTPEGGSEPPPEVVGLDPDRIKEIYKVDDVMKGSGGEIWVSKDGEWKRLQDVRVPTPSGRGGADIAKHLMDREERRSHTVADRRQQDYERSIYGDHGGEDGKQEEMKAKGNKEMEKITRLDEEKKGKDSGVRVAKPPKPPPPTVGTFGCKSNKDCWDHYKSNQYYCNRGSGQCIKCPDGMHGKKDGTAECCSDEPNPGTKQAMGSTKVCPRHAYCDKVGIGKGRALDLNKDGICDTCGGRISGQMYIIDWPDPSRRHCPEYE